MANLTLLQMFALLADNETGQISAQDLRDVIQALFERTDGTNPIPALLFDTAGSVHTQVAGHMHWDTTENTIGVDVSADGSLQIGFEEWFNGRNTTGSTILNGTPVRITSGGGNQVFIAKDNGLGVIAGVTTEDIPNASTGRVTTFGQVHDLDTSAFADGAELFSTSTGTLSTSPSSSRAGIVAAAHPTQGILFVSPDRRVTSSGTTAQRPTTVATTYVYFDTTLGIPVFWNGSVWKNASGATV